MLSDFPIPCLSTFTPVVQPAWDACLALSAPALPARRPGGSLPRNDGGNNVQERHHDAPHGQTHRETGNSLLVVWSRRLVAHSLIYPNVHWLGYVSLPKYSGRIHTYRGTRRTGGFSNMMSIRLLHAVRRQTRREFSSIKQVR